MANDLGLDKDRKDWALQLQNNPIFRGIFQEVRNKLEARTLSCRDEKEAMDIARTKQILAGLEREIQRVIQTGNVAEIRLKEIQGKKVSLFRR